RSDEAQGIGNVGLDDQEPTIRCRLAQRLVQSGLRFCGQPVVFHIANDTDDFHPSRRPHIIHIDSLADRVLVREELTRHGLVDNCYRWSIGGVCGTEVTSSAQGDAQQAEIIQARTVYVSNRRGWSGMTGLPSIAKSSE